MPEETPQPPSPPEINRRLQFHLTQLIGVPLLALIPLLALFGVFGLRVTEQQAANAELELHVHYPSRLRYGMLESLEVSLRNTSAQALASVSLRFERAYLDVFSELHFTPDVHTLSNGAYVVLFPELAAGETRRVSVELQPKQFGLHRGSITATVADAEEVRVLVETLVFP